MRGAGGSPKGAASVDAWGGRELGQWPQQETNREALVPGILNTGKTAWLLSLWPQGDPAWE